MRNGISTRRRRLREAPLVAVCVVALLATTTSVAVAADPEQFSSLSANCDHNYGGNFYGSPVSSSHPDVLTRYTANGGQASLDGRPVGAGDIVWSTGESVAANDSPSVYASCYSSAMNVPFTATYFDRPTTPTTFSGAGNTWGNALGFVAPGEAQYVADLSLTGGGVELQSTGSYDSQNFASSGQFPLGTVRAGTQQLSLAALDGPRPTWTVTIRALPVAISGLTFDQPLTRPGAFVEARYTTSGDTAISALVKNGAGQVVKTLASGLSVGSGDHSLPWDGRSDSGQALPDAAYDLQLDSRDPSGLTSSAITAITVDGTPPNVTITTPTVVAPDQAVSGQVSDALTGIAAVELEDAASYESLRLPQGQTTFSFKPRYGPWSLGAHSLTVSASDGAGNVRNVAFAFTVATNPGSVSGRRSVSGPRCTRAAARAAVAKSRSMSRAIRRLRNGRYVVGKVICADLDRDGDRDMAALMVCCTVSSYSPVVIFRNTAAKWRPSYTKTKLTVFRMSRRANSLRLKTPRYRRSDANCCPSRYRYYKIGWSGKQFRLSRARG
jgi:hypothetical protein